MNYPRSRRLPFGFFTFAVVILLVVGYTTKGGQANTTSPAIEPDFVIEAMFPVSGANGALSVRYLIAIQAMIYEIENINARSDVLPNATLGYSIFDDKNENLHVIMAEAIRIASQYRPSFQCDADDKKKLCTKDSESPSSRRTSKRRVSAIIGPATSGNTVPAASLLGLYNIPLVGYSASSSLLSDKSRFKSFLRTIPSDKYQAEAIASLVEHFGWNYVFFIASDDEYGRQGLASFKTAARKLKVCTANDVNIAFQRNDAANQVRDVVASLKKEKRVKVVVLFMFTGQAASILDEAKRQGVGNITWIFSDGIGSGILGYNVSRELLHGAFTIGFVYGRIPQFEEHLAGITVRDARGNRWLTKLLETTLRCSIGDNGAVAARRCSRHEKLPLSTDDIVNSRSTIVNIVNGVRAIAFGLNNLLKCREGDACPDKSLPLSGKDLYMSILNSTFVGAFGNKMVAFDEHGDRATKEYIFHNIQHTRATGKADFVPVATWSSELPDKLSFLDGPVAWNAGSQPESTCSKRCTPGQKQVGQSICCWACERCPKGTISVDSGATNCTRCPENYYADEGQTRCLRIEVHYVDITDPFSIIIVTISCLGLVAMLAVSVLFVRVRGTPLVQDSGEFLLGLFVLSCVLAFAFSIFQVTLYRTDAACRFLNISLLFTILLVAAALLAKTKACDRNLRLFASHLPKPAAQHCAPAMLVAFLLVQLILVGIWCLINAPVVRLIRETEARQLRECDSNWSAEHFIAYFFPILVLVVATVLAFKERDERENHSEAKYISFCTISLCILLIAFFPTYRFVRGITTSIVIATTSLVGAFAVIGCVILPKVYILLVQPQRNVPGNQRSNEPTVSSAHTVSHMGSASQPEFVRCLETGEAVRTPNDMELASTSSAGSAGVVKDTPVL